MAGNNQPRIVGYNPNTGEPVYAGASDGSRKTIKVIIIAVLAVLLASLGWIIYNTFFNYTKVDLFEGKSDIEVYGYSGSGVLEYYDEIYRGDYYGEPQYAEKFYQTINYVPDKTENLSNGDIVIITASYDKAAAKKAKVKPVSDTKEYEVTGLKERYASNASDISAEDFAAMKQFMNDYAAREAYDSYNNSKSEGMVKLYYVSPPVADIYDSDHDFMMGIYKVVYDDWDNKKVTVYMPVVMGPLDKGPDYTGEIDGLVREGRVSIYAKSSQKDINPIIEELNTYYNRCTITELKI